MAGRREPHRTGSRGPAAMERGPRPWEFALSLAAKHGLEPRSVPPGGRSWRLSTGTGRAGRPRGHLSGPLDVGPHVSKIIPGADLGPKAGPPCPPLEPVPTPRSLATSLRASQATTRSSPLRNTAPNGCRLLTLPLFLHAGQERRSGRPRTAWISGATGNLSLRSLRWRHCSV